MGRERKPQQMVKRTDCLFGTYIQKSKVPVPQADNGERSKETEASEERSTCDLRILEIGDISMPTHFSEPRKFKRLCQKCRQHSING